MPDVNVRNESLLLGNGAYILDSFCSITKALAFEKGHRSEEECNDSRGEDKFIKVHLVTYPAELQIHR